MSDKPVFWLHEVDRLDYSPAYRKFVHACLRRAQEAQDIPRRAPPDGDSQAVFALTGPENRIGGFATFYEVNERRLWLDILWVEPEYRRLGVGSWLLRRVAETAKAQRLKAVALGHVENNTAMVALMKHDEWPIAHIVRQKEIG